MCECEHVCIGTHIQMDTCQGYMHVAGRCMCIVSTSVHKSHVLCLYMYTHGRCACKRVGVASKGGGCGCSRPGDGAVLPH